MSKKKIIVIVSIVLAVVLTVSIVLAVVFTKPKNNNASANATSITTRVEILQSQLVKVQEDLLKISTGDSAEVIGNKFDELTTKISEVAGNLSKLAGEVLGIKELSQSNYETLLTKVESIEGSLIEIKSDLSELKTLSTRVEALETSIQSLTNRIVTLENNSADEAELQELRQELAVIQAELNILKTNEEKSVKFELLYDYASSDDSINLGYVNGIFKGESVSIDFNNYDYLIVSCGTNLNMESIYEGSVFIDLNKGRNDKIIHAMNCFEDGNNNVNYQFVINKEKTTLENLSSYNDANIYKIIAFSL